ncbi:MAG: aldose 1-epimerase [Clostridia bacterium]|nr:aldose 1-epimerase [Clostridia bacterium]
MENIVLELNSSRAEICADMGCNCISYITEGCELMRRPASPEVHRNAPNVYGVPLLFPPNRIRGGRFTFDGREYQLPITEPERGNFIHGTLSETAFDVVEQTAASVMLRYEATEDKPYLTFPHAFDIVVRWELKEDGLHHTVTATNRSQSRMPVGVGFHTALNAYFMPDDREPSHYRIRLSSEEEIVNGPPMFIPTGERKRDTELLTLLNGEGYQPQGEYMSRHLLRGDGGAQLVHLPSGRSVHYDVSDALRYWVLWNGNGTQGFVCPEPQTWMIDAPNQSQDTEKSGFRALEPGESLTVQTHLYLR